MYHRFRVCGCCRRLQLQQRNAKPKHKSRGSVTDMLAMYLEASTNHREALASRQRAEVETLTREITRKYQGSLLIIFFVFFSRGCISQSIICHILTYHVCGLKPGTLMSWRPTRGRGQGSMMTVVMTKPLPHPPPLSALHPRVPRTRLSQPR